ncbi:MAG TPA: response regulator, partial [Flavobacterium sp.]|nr:response regulator [Flavobacterium sp.]
MNHTVTAILVDDEKHGREVLAKLIAKKHPEVRIIGQAANVEQAYEMCATLLPDIVFLDIQMPQQNGFNLLKKFGRIPFEVIFVTSFDHYAITAIKFNALDYLLKPI